ncbi:hypothetical protein RRG08_015860 [Elysia crispata]|uniref:Uncharacterized protein n=1 Tax=Elysia crispata TaxID=231223 RepID=A0AAE0XPM2_9GAST|nr:hypothetical protein RRG08_015860 [Elysia crispata]
MMTKNSGEKHCLRQKPNHKDGIKEGDKETDCGTIERGSNNCGVGPSWLEPLALLYSSTNIAKLIHPEYRSGREGQSEGSRRTQRDNIDDNVLVVK